MKIDVFPWHEFSRPDGLGIAGVACVTVDGGHVSLLNAPAVVENLRSRCQAVGGTGSVGDDVVGVGIVEFVVAAHDDVKDTVFDGSGDDDFFGAGVEVGLEALGIAEGAGAFEDDIDAGPVDFGRMVLGGISEGLTVDEDGVVAVGNAAIPSAVDGVELQQVRREFCAALDCIHMDDLKFIG